MQSRSPFDPRYQLSDGGARLPLGAAVAFPIGAHALAPDGRRRRLLMLGGSLLQLPAIRMAKEEGWEVVLADGNAQALARPWVDRFEHVDLKDLDGLLAMARRQAEGEGLHGVFTAATDFSASVAWVAERLGLPGLPYEVALNASSKLRMRRLFRSNGVPSPRFVELESGAAPDPAAIRAALRLPAVVKPIDNMGARGVRRIDDWSELEPALADARGFSRQGTVIVEELIAGPEYSIDSLVVGGRLIPCGLASRHVKFPPFFVEVGHTLPSDLPPERERELVAVFARAVAALGIVDGVAKGDVFYTADGPVIGEIAARLSGGYMSGWTFPLASGLELTRAALYLAMGLPLPDLAPTLDRVSAERAFVAIPGVVAAFEGIEGIEADYRLDGLFLRAAPGVRTVFPRNNVEKAGNVIAAADSRAEACRRAERAVAAVAIRMAPGDAETTRFLFAPQPGQALAYPELARRLPDYAWPAAAGLDPEGFHYPPGWSEAWGGELDWSWRSLAESLAAWSAKTGLGLAAGTYGPADALLWLAIARGGLPGALYVADTLRAGGGAALLAAARAGGPRP